MNSRKKKRLLRFIATNGEVSLGDVMREIYEEKSAAKDALEEFSDNDWINLEGFGSFSITDQGAKRYQKLKRGVTVKDRQGDKSRRLDTF